MAYIRAAQGGNYSATSTWVGGVVPTSSDIACCGSFRVNLDLTDITATLSTTNTDWVAAGGSALSTTHTGGFYISGASARNIAGFRYSFYRSAGTGATNAQLTVNAGDVTISALTQVGDTFGGTAQGVIYMNNSTPASLSLGNVTCLDWSTYYSCYLVDLTRSTTPTGVLTLTTRAFNSPSGLGANHALLFTNSYAGAVNWTMLAPLPRGASGYPCVNFGSTTVSITVTMPSDGFPIDCTGVGSPNGGYVVSSSRCTSLTFSNSVYAQNGGLASTNPMFYVSNDTSAGTVTFNSWVYIDNVTFLLATDRMVVDFKGAVTLVARVSSKYLLSCGGSALAGAWHFRGAFLFSNASTVTTGLGTGTSILGLPHYAPVRFYSTFTANGYTTMLYAVSFTSYNGGAYPITFDGVVDLTAAIVGNGSSDGENCYWVVSGSGSDSMRSFVFNSLVKLPTSRVGATGDGKAFLCVLGGVTSTGSVVQFLGGVVSGVIPLASTFKAFAAQIALVGADNTGGTVPLITARCGYAFTPVLVSGTVKPSTSGVHPIQAPYTLTGSYSLYDANTSGVQPYALATGAVVPSASDVRAGVSVGNTVGTLTLPLTANVLSGVTFDGGTKTGTLALSSVADTVINSVTPRFDTIDANIATANAGVTAANTAVAGIKAKTDQLAFSTGGVIAQTADGADYTGRFDTLETMLSYVPTLTYTARLNAINDQLDTIQSIAAGGGVDLTPITTSITALDGKVSVVKAKTDQMAFTTGGVVADVAVSVQQVIDYSARFASLDQAVAAVNAKTAQLTFDQAGVKASAVVDLSVLDGSLDNVFTELQTKATQTTLDAGFANIEAQLDTIQNATGAIDLTPLQVGVSAVYTQVMQIPRLTYSASFATVNGKLDNIATNMGSVDLQPVLDAIADIPEPNLQPVLDAIADMPEPNLTPLQTVLGTLQTDVNTLKDTAARTETLSNTIKTQLSRATGVDLSGVEHQLTLLNSKFDGVDAPVRVIPAGGSGTTVLYAHCLDLNGTPVAGQIASIEVAQVVGDGTLLPNHTLQSTSNADGLVSFVLPRNAGISVIFNYRGRKERLTLTDSATQALPSIVAKL